jgi:hypothetical protein
MDQISRKSVRVNLCTSTAARAPTPIPQCQSNPQSRPAVVHRACPTRPRRASDAVSEPRLASIATLPSNDPIGQGAARHRMTARFRRALKIRVALLEGKQSSAADRVDGLLAEMADRQQCLRRFRELLLRAGEPVNSTWLEPATNEGRQ